MLLKCCCCCRSSKNHHLVSFFKYFSTSQVSMAAQKQAIRPERLYRDKTGFNPSTRSIIHHTALQQAARRVASPRVSTCLRGQISSGGGAQMVAPASDLLTARQWRPAKAGGSPSKNWAQDAEIKHPRRYSALLPFAYLSSYMESKIMFTPRESTSNCSCFLVTIQLRISFMCSCPT